MTHTHTHVIQDLYLNSRRSRDPRYETSELLDPLCNEKQSLREPQEHAAGTKGSGFRSLADQHTVLDVAPESWSRVCV